MDKAPNVQMIPISKIEVGERGREDNGDLIQLQFSIDTSGLLIPIVVDKTGEHYTLVDGFRRLSCYKALSKLDIPAILKENLSEDKQKEIEHVTNIHRKQYNWLEESRAYRDLHRIWANEYNTSKSSAVFGRWTQKDTADKLKISEGKISQDIQLADAVDNYPEMQKLTTRKEAMREIRAREDNKTGEDASWIQRIARDTFLYHQFPDSINLLEDKSIHLFITDLSDYPLEDILPQLHKKLQPTGHMFIFVGHDKFARLFSSLSSLGLRFQDKPLTLTIKGENVYSNFVWCSSSSGEPPFGIKESTSVRKDEFILHHKEKPYSFYFQIVGKASNIANIVCDPCSHGINMVRACLDLRRGVKCFCPDKILYDKVLLGAIKE